MRQQGPIEGRDRLEEVPAASFHVGMIRHGLHVDRLVARLGLALGRAHVDADAAAGTVVGGDLDGEQMVGQIPRAELLGYEVRRGALDRSRREDLHPDRGMRANHGAFAAIDADGRIPDRDRLGDSPLLVLRRTARECPVNRERAHRQLVAVAGHQDRGHLLDEVGRVVGHRKHERAVASGLAQGNVAQPTDRQVDGGEVAIDDSLAALRVRLLHEALDAGDRVGRGQHAGEVEETGLHDRVDAVAHANFFGNGERIDHPQIDRLVDELLLDVSGQLIPDLVRPIWRVEQDRRSVLGELDDLGPLEQTELVARDEVRPLDEIGGANRLGTEPQVGDGDRPRLLGVVDEVALGEQVRAFADDLDRRLVRADGPVRAEPEEHRLDLAGRADVAEFRVDGQAQVRHVVVDADREVALGSLGGELIEDRFDHRRRDFLRREPISTARDPRRRRERRLFAVHLLRDGGHDFEVERFAHGARFLGPIQDGDRAHSRRQRGEKLVRGERLEQPHLDQPDLLAGRDERVNRFLDRAGRRSHDDDDTLRVGGAVVVDQPIAPAGPFGQLVHDVLDDPGHRKVVGVRRLTGLEEHIGVLRGAPNNRGVGSEAAVAEREDVVIAQQRSEVIVLEHDDLVDLVGRAEAVEEMEERDAGAKRCRVGHQREVVRFLDGAGR